MKKFSPILFVLLLFYNPAKASIQFNEGDRILLYGNSFIERMQQNGFLEATIQRANPGKKIEMRSLAWTGDELGYRLRPERYVNHLKKLLELWPANHVILGFGLYESFAGASGIKKFKEDLNGYLNEIERRHHNAKIIILSPIATENLNHSHFPNSKKRNNEIKSYSDVMSSVCLLYTSPSPRDRTRSRMPSSA